VNTLATQKKSEARKGQILKAAERIFARKGFPNSTISDVAREAGVSDATIYEYFPSKEELLFSIPGETARKGRENLEFHLKHIRGAANKIRAIIYHYLWFYQEELDYASVAMLILKQNRKFLETKAYRDVRDMSRLILDVLEEGITSHEFAPETSPILTRSVILGAIEHNVVRKILLGKPENLLELVDPLSDLIVEGIGVRTAGKGWNLKIVLEPEEKMLNTGPDEGEPDALLGGPHRGKQRGLK
jgi:AcrR family transcriptional regulator